MLDLHPYYQRGKQRGLEKGLEQGLEKGLEQGREQALIRLLERRLARSLTASEQRRISARMVKHGHDMVDEAILDLSRAKLAAWLAPNGHRPKERHGK